MIRIVKTQPFYTTVTLAKKLGVSISRIQLLCRTGRIAGAQRQGRDWVIPSDYVIKPSRAKTGGKRFAKISSGQQTAL